MSGATNREPEIDLTLCTRCGDCVAACPSGALSMTAAGDLAIDLERCAYCADCEDVCPVGAIALPFDIVIGHHQERGEEE